MFSPMAALLDAVHRARAQVEGAALETSADAERGPYACSILTLQHGFFPPFVAHKMTVPTVIA